MVAALCGEGNIGDVKAVEYAREALKLGAAPTVEIDLDSPLFEAAVDLAVKDTAISKAFSE